MAGATQRPGKGNEAVFEKGALEEIAENGGRLAESLQRNRFAAPLRVGRGNAAAHQGPHGVNAAAFLGIEKDARGVQQGPFVIGQPGDAAVKILDPPGQVGKLSRVQAFSQIGNDRFGFGQKNRDIDHAAVAAARPAGDL